MKTWNSLFVRHGWLLVEKEANVFDCRFETEGNIEFLLENLNQAGVSYHYDEKSLVMHSEPILEEAWIEMLDFEFRGHGGHLWFKPGQDEPKVRELDTYIAGVVRQLNRLGFYTNGSCDGHDRKAPSVMVVKNGKDIKQLLDLFSALGMKGLRYRESKQSHLIGFPCKREDLFELVEKMSMVEAEWVETGIDFIKENLFQIELEEVLSVPGESGNEAKIRRTVKEKLAPHVDMVTVDAYGNLLAEKKCRSGNGPTILLNAHLDTVEEIVTGRHIVKEDGRWSSSEGILGADDRAGVAVLLKIAEQLTHSTFSGKIKFIFSVEEEIGLVGASMVDATFLEDVDAAIVVDRRGTGDIVTSCGGYIPFCDEAYGKWIEQVASEAGLSGWACTPGGSSDTRIWAEHGIQSVNLSAGYNYEHTDAEYLDVAACYGTVKLIEAVLSKGRELRQVVSGIRREKAGK